MSEQDYQDFTSDEGMKKHLKCLYYKILKDEWETGIGEGETRQCPGCKMRVQK